MPLSLTDKSSRRYGKVEVSIDAHYGESSSDLFRDIRSRVPVIDPEVRLQNLYNGMIRSPTTVGEALSFQEQDVFVGYSLSELVQEPGLADPSLAHDGDRLTSACLSPLKSVKQEFEFSFSSDESSQPTLSTHVEPGRSGARSDDAINPQRFVFALDLSLSQGLETEEPLGELERILGDIGGTRLRQLLHPGRHIDGVADCGELDAKIVP